MPHTPNHPAPPRFDQGGLFGADVVPRFSREEFSRRREQDIVRQQGEQVSDRQQSILSGSRDLRRVGAQIGNLIKRRTGKTLTQDEQNIFAIKEVGSQAFQDRLAEEENRGTELSAFDKQMMMMSEHAKAALAVGDTNTFNALTAQMNKLGQENRLIEANIRKAEGEAESAGNPLQLQNDISKQIFTSTERTEARESGRALAKQMRATDNVVGIMEELFQEGVNPNIAMRASGTVVSLVNEVRAAAGVAKDMFQLWVDDDGTTRRLPNTAGGQDQLGRRDADYQEALDFIKVPDSIVGANERARYKAAVIQMAYAAWRQNEGSGSRQASDRDILLALDGIGANSGDVRSMLGTVLQAARLGVENERDTIRNFTTIGRASGLTGDYMRDVFFGTDFSRAEDQFARLQNRIDTFLGDNPGTASVSDGDPTPDPVTAPVNIFSEENMNDEDFLNTFLEPAPAP